MDTRHRRNQRADGVRRDRPGGVVIVDWMKALMAARHACSCPQPIPGVTRGRVNPACPRHGWEGDPVAEEGRSIVENDAIQAEYRDG